jgi:hypothetical protein
MVIFVWVALAFAGVGAGAWVQDRWPRSIVARLVALAGCCWFGGVWLAVLLLQ